MGCSTERSFCFWGKDFKRIKKGNYSEGAIMLSPEADGKMAKAGLIKSRASDMKRSRDKRRDAGMVEFRCWCTPEKKLELQKIVDNTATKK